MLINMAYGIFIYNHRSCFAQFHNLSIQSSNVTELSDDCWEQQIQAIWETTKMNGRHKLKWDFWRYFYIEIKAKRRI